MRDSHVFGAVIADALANGAVVRFSAEGASMYPTIRDGDIITIAPVSPGEVVRGDVLLCRHERRLLAHRVVHVALRGVERVFRLRGDAKAGCDAPVGADAIVGRVIAVSRNGRVASLCGRAARLRHEARAFLSGVKARVAGREPGWAYRV